MKKELINAIISKARNYNGPLEDMDLSRISDLVFEERCNRKSTTFRSSRTSSRSIRDVEVDKILMEAQNSLSDDTTKKLVNYYQEKYEIDNKKIKEDSGISRSTLSNINKDRAISKKTLFQVALGLKLSIEESYKLLESSGYTFNPTDIFDKIVYVCIIKMINNLDDVNEVLLTAGYDEDEIFKDHLGD